ncbi:MAG TPA: potassium channel protein [Pirellulales bacterium]
MQTSSQRVLIGMCVLLFTCLVAVGVYVSAGWSVLDAVYMVVITVYGVGYGETRPLTEPWLRVFTICLVVAGCSSAVYVIGGFVQMLAEGEINRILGARRMTQGIEKLNGHTIVCGFGRVGQILVRELLAAQHAFVIVDTDAVRLREAEAQGCLVLVGDAREESVLIAAGVKRAKVLASVLPDDTANVFITLSARELNSDMQIVARGESPSTEKKLIRSGANQVVLPAAIGATRIAHLITRPSAETLLKEALGSTQLHQELNEIGLDLTEIPIAPGSALQGRTLKEVEISGQSGFVIVAIKGGDGKILRHPGMDVMLQGGDTIILVGHREALPDLAVRAKPQSFRSYRGARVEGST